jgi:3-phosphoshikimate 1-carboxyvinyltransferase
MPMIIITSKPKKLSGELQMPGDKSITHRAAMIGALARGTTEIKGYLDAGDCRTTINCLKTLGVSITVDHKKLLIEGCAMNLRAPTEPLDAGNSGTTARLLLGILTGQPYKVKIIGDQSLSRRPMQRVIEPLRLMGASFTIDRHTLPLTINGGKVKPITYRSPYSSAQVKSAVLLAGLYAYGETTVIEPYASRNHSELMLAYFGAKLASEGNKVKIEGQPQLKAKSIQVPGDISAAAYLMVAATLVPQAKVLLRGIGINETRSGVIDVLREMGADIELRNHDFWGLEPVADILIHGGQKLRGTSISGKIIPRLIDEIPVLAVAAAVAEGKTVIRDAAELRVKESDRIAVLAAQLQKMGVKINETADGMIIDGGVPLTGARVESGGDHRIAMSLAVAGLAAKGDTTIHGAEAVAISFPGFMAAIRSLIG